MTALLKSTVFIIDDDPAFKSNLSWQIEKIGFTTKTFSFLETFFTFYKEDIPGCIIIDIQTTGNLGVDFIEVLRSKKIYLSVIFLSEKPEVAMAIKAIKLGACDFFPKTIEISLLVNSLHYAMKTNHIYRIHEKKRDEAKKLYLNLTLREKEILRYVLQGLTNKAMANKLSLTIKTIEAHRAKIMQKMQANSLSQLIIMVITFNLIEENEAYFLTQE